MKFDQAWLSDLLNLQKRASELAKNNNSTSEIQDLVKTILNQYGINDLPWYENSQSSSSGKAKENAESKAASQYFNIDISEKKQYVQIQILMPGIEEPNNLLIKLSGNALDISGKSSLITENSGSFSREIRLPAEVTSTGVSALYKDDYLTITLPKIPPEGEVIPFDFYPSSSQE
ncbi:MAG TPA: hypothetical protein DDW50_07700 [Firmicutes bacterium]|jgi:HSP20 family molecular chaperone IbpA|nr:hypothetical protein [Bacillota bacterium]